MKLTEKQKLIIKEYKEYFTTTDENNIIKWIDRACILSELQGSCCSQLSLLEKLINDGLLSIPKKQKTDENKKGTIPCSDGKRHWWPSGWICEKCGLFRDDYEKMKKDKK